MRKAAIPIIVMFIIMGCTIMQMQEEISETEGRIALKQAQLSELEAQRERLGKHQALLVERLDRTKLTAQQLNRELDQMIHQNRQLAAMAEEQGQEIEEINQEIEALEAKQASLARMAASGDAEAAKEQQILELQQEIRNYLLLGLKSKHRKRLQ